MLFGPALCYRNPKQHTVTRQNGKPTRCVLASVKVHCEDPPTRMAKKNEAHHQSLTKDPFHGVPEISFFY